VATIRDLAITKLVITSRVITKWEARARRMAMAAPARKMAVAVGIAPVAAMTINCPEITSRVASSWAEIIAARTTSQLSTTNREEAITPAAITSRVAIDRPAISS
jgi:hypothetical protein